jgi:two-component system, OmpR family, response regulator
MRILLTEDDEEIALSIKKGLELDSYAVDVVYDGETSLTYALSGDYDTAILDRMLPIMDGIEVCQRLRDQHSSLPILMLTARGELDDRVEGLDAGADDYLVKPFAFAELLARVRALTRRPPHATMPILSVGELRLDTARRRAYRAEVEINLSAREFALLECLMRQPGRVYTRDELTRRAWNDEANVLPSNVETYISYLRAKIDKPFEGSALIHTIWGQGYKIEE